MKWLLAIMLVLAGCGRSSVSTAPSAPVTIKVESPNFRDGQPLPASAGKDHGNVSPSLKWAEPPGGTMSFVLLAEDPDAPGGKPFVHWIVANIPASLREIRQGRLPTGAVQGKNDVGSNDYFGPEPPSGTHHYHFKLYALNSVLKVREGMTKEDVIDAMSGHVLAMGEIVGLYSKGD